MGTEAKQRGTRVVLIAGVAALLAAAGVWYVGQNSTGPATGGTTPSGPNVSVVVAKNPIASGLQITSDLVTTQQLPVSAQPGGAFSNPTAVVGQFAAHAISPNSPITQNDLVAGATSVPAQPLAITKGYVAMAIPSSSGGTAADQNSVGYYIQPGDHVDILIDPGNGTVRFGFQDVRVLKIGDYSASGALPAAPSAYIVELPRNQAEVLSYIVAGKGPQTIVRYVLRPQAEYGSITSQPGQPKYPNYEDNTGANLPAPNDPGATPALLSQLFPH